MPAKINFNKEDFINNYNQLKSAKKMAKYYGCCKKTILDFAKEIGYDNKIKKLLTDSQVEEIISQYYSKTSIELGRFYNVSPSTITNIWKKNNLSGNSTYLYPYNFNYFSTIDSADKAYFLGLLAADGNVYTKKDRNIVRIALEQEDRYILEILKKYIDSEKPLYMCTRKLDNEKISYQYKLELCGEQIVNDLRKYGIVDKKTYSYEMTKLPDNLMSHFIRGYFDGDGSINIRNKMFFNPSQYNIAISGFQHNLLCFQKYLLLHNIKTVFIEDKREYHNNLTFGSLRCPNINEKYNFLKYIYDNCGILYMSRKKFKADCFFYSMEENFSRKQNKYLNIINNAVLNEADN